MLWKPDPQIDAMRKLPGWSEFHKEAGKQGFCFDHMIREGRAYSCAATAIKRNDLGGWYLELIVKGTGKTPFEAMIDAYARSGRVTETLDGLVARMRGESVSEVQQVEEFDTTKTEDFDFESIFA